MAVVFDISKSTVIIVESGKSYFYCFCLAALKHLLESFLSEYEKAQVFEKFEILVNIEARFKKSWKTTQNLNKTNFVDWIKFKIVLFDWLCDYANVTVIWDKVFKNGPRKICGIQPLKKFELIWSFKTDHINSNFLNCLSQNLIGPFLNTFPQLQL